MSRNCVRSWLDKMSRTGYLTNSVRDNAAIDTELSLPESS